MPGGEDPTRKTEENKIMRVRDHWIGGYSYAQNRGNQENARKKA
jgi:hypothetical protein